MNATRQPRIRKAKEVKGKTLVFRDATVEGAAFILSLRTDEKKSRYLSATAPDLDSQRSWLRNYAESTDHAYFIIENEGEPIGTVRLYDAKGDSFCWGSWILKDTRPSHAAMESALMVYALAVDHLGFSASHFDVRKANERVWQFHERFGAQRTHETDLDYFYSLNLEAIQAARRRYARFLAQGVTVIQTAVEKAP